MPPTAAELLRALESHEPADDREHVSFACIVDFLDSSTPFSRANPSGHITASAVVARRQGQEFLLVWHKKLDRWLQPGGHLEPEDESVFAAALREAREETGIESFGFPIGERILDVDIHPIPPHGSDPAHLHYDIRHLLTAETRSPLTLEKTAWFSFDQALAAADDSLARALLKASLLLSGSAPVPHTASRTPRT